MKHASQTYVCIGMSKHATFVRHPVAAAIAAAFFSVSSSAWAQLPSGASVINGTAGIVSNGGAMTVTNSPNAILNWNSFSIGTQNSVRFAQQNAASQVLNRVVGNDPSSILGSLSSNGGVWLVNPHGVLFGPNARINVGGLVASTLGISNEDFLAGRFRFEGAGTKGGQVLNQGEINTTFGGRVWLMGDSVRNEGLVQSPGGNIVLAAGKSIELVDSGMPNVTVRVTAPENEALNLGSLLASAGGSIDVHGGIVNQQGIVRADSVGTDAAGRVVIKAQGDVKLGDASNTSASSIGTGKAGTLLVESASGTTLVSGQASATSAEGKGGTIHLLGKNVGLVEQAAVDASGAGGGGEILIGGDYLGSNPKVPNAQATFVGEGATLKANATPAGDGGRVIVWSNDATRVYGTIEARGAGHEGKGGFVETSGGYLDARPKKVDVGSESGNGGTWLLDPIDITIADRDGNRNVTDGPNFTSTNDGSVVSTSTINNALNIGGNVRVITGALDQTDPATNARGDITVANNISKTTANAASLILLAGGNITVNPGVSISSETRTALDVTLYSNITSFSPATGVVRFPPPADSIGGIIIGGSIKAGNIAIESGGRTPGGNAVELNNATLDGRSLTVRAGRFTGENFVNISGSRVFMGASTVTMSEFVRISGQFISGQPTVDAGGPIRIFAALGEIQGGTWTSRASPPVSGPEVVAILLNTSAISGMTLNTPSGRWVVVGSSNPDRYQLQPTYVRVNRPLDLLAANDFAGLLGPESGVGNHGFVLTQPLTANIRVDATRTYDGTPAATVSAGQVIPVSGWSTLAASFGQDGPIPGTFSDKNAGLNKSVSLPFNDDITPFSLTYRNAPVRGETQRYTADITRLSVTASGTAANKVYDGTTAATLTAVQLSPTITGDNIAVSGAVGTFDNKNVGNAKTVTVSGSSLTGTDAGNYQLVGLAISTADITPKTVARLVTADNKVYDATRTAIVRGSVSGIIPGDDASLNSATGLFDNKNVGIGKTVTIEGGALAGADAGNYALQSGAAITTADITPRPITAAGTLAADKVYDGTRNATIQGGVLSQAIAGDDLTLSGATGLFDTKNVGTDKLVTISGGSLAGADRDNYSLIGTAATTADVTRKPITADGLLAADKVYDGNRTAAIQGGLPSQAIAGDDLTLNGATGLFDTKNVGTDKLVTISGGSLAGADRDNYSLTGTGTTAADITAKPITIGITGGSTDSVVKEYDATTVANLPANQFALNGIIANDVVSVAGPIQGSYDSANVGTEKLVTVTGPFQISGVDAPNYSVQGINLTNAVSNTVDGTVSRNVGTITPATLAYNADPAVRAPGLPIVGLTGKVTGFKGADNLASATSGSLDWQSRNVTVDSPPGAYGIEGVGLAAGNYVFTQAPGNATALVLIPINTPDAPQQQAVESNTSAVNAAISAMVAAISPRDTGGGVFDISSPTANKSFAPINIASMSQEELAQLLESRKNFKRKLFADAIYKLEIDPSLADVRLCATVADAGSGLCRITTAQLDEIHAKKAQAEPAQKNVKARTASLPQIERKIAVLFGINDYDDKTIPRLENAVPDVEAVSKTLQEKLGYEVKVVRNPNKADIIRTLNELATQINSSDSVIVYYAGHGYSLEKNGAGYWLPSDAPASDPSKWISNNDIAKLLAGIRSQQMALISDSCYSGAFARDGMASVGRGVTADDILTKRSVVVLSSGGDEPVTDEGKDGHSIFAWNLMKAIGSVDNWRPGSTIFDEVQREVKKEFPQTPRYGSVTSAGHQQGGDYLFELR